MVRYWYAEKRTAALRPTRISLNFVVHRWTVEEVCVVSRIGRLDDPVEFLVNRRFGFARHFPAMLLNIQEGTALGDQSLIVDAESYRKELQALSPSDLVRLVQSEKRKVAEEAVAEAAKQEAQRFFNLPSANAPFDHYCKLAYWTLDECVALSLGKNPAIVKWESVKGCVAVSPFAAKYARLRDITQRAKWAQQLFDPVYPTIYLSWAKKSDLQICSDLVGHAIDAGISLKGWHDLYEDCLAKRRADFDGFARTREEDLAGYARQRETDLAEYAEEKKKLAEAFAVAMAEKHHQIEELQQQLSTEAKRASRPLETRERENLQLIALLGAIRGYGYDPGTRSKAASLIEQDTEKLGVRFTDDRIRHHLQKASELLPGDWRTRVLPRPNTG